MLDIKLYDQHDLENKVIIWRKSDEDYPKSFLVMNQNIWSKEMLILEWGLYATHYCDEFYKVDTDYPYLFVLKERFK